MSYDDAEEPRTDPWRRGRPETDSAPTRRVVLDGWDDELTQAELAAKPHVDAADRRDRRRARAKRAGNLLLFALAVTGAAAGAAVGWMHLVMDPLVDAHAYYEAASRLNAGLPLYPLDADPSRYDNYPYPPLLAVVLRPLALLPYEWFAIIWELIVGATLVGIVRRLGAGRRSTWIALGILAVPIAWALTVAQAHIPMTLLMAIGQPWSIAIAANIKLFPAAIALLWFARRDWQAFFAFCTWSVLLLLAQLVLEPAGTLAYFRWIGLGLVGDVRNISPYSVSPTLWAGLVVVGALTVLATARTRWGWPVAVTFATLASPRVLLYMLTGLLAAVREPNVARSDGAKWDNDPAAAYRRATR